MQMMPRGIKLIQSLRVLLRQWIMWNFFLEGAAVLLFRGETCLVASYRLGQIKPHGAIICPFRPSLFQWLKNCEARVQGGLLLGMLITPVPCFHSLVLLCVCILQCFYEYCVEYLAVLLYYCTKLFLNGIKFHNDSYPEIHFGSQLN